MGERVVVYGAYGHAKVIVDILGLTGFDVVGLIDYRNQYPVGCIVAGKPVLGNELVLDQVLANGVTHAFVAIGQNETRLKVGEDMVDRGFALVNAIHPTSVIAASVKIGAGTMVGALTVVNPGTVVGNHAVLNTASSVDHDCLISDGVQVCPGARLAGSVQVGRCTEIGTGASVIPNIRLGAHSTIGAGSVVVRDIPDNVTAYGNPAHHAMRFDMTEHG